MNVTLSNEADEPVYSINTYGGSGFEPELTADRFMVLIGEFKKAIDEGEVSLDDVASIHSITVKGYRGEVTTTMHQLAENASKDARLRRMLKMTRESLPALKL